MMSQIRVAAAFIAAACALAAAPSGLCISAPPPRDGSVIAGPSPAAQAGGPVVATLEKSLFRVNATNQTYDFVHPWMKRPPFARRGIGPLISGGRVLVTAEQIANYTYVELETADGSQRCPASVELFDYDCNLAILKPQDPGFLGDAQAIPIAGEATVGKSVDVVQLESNGLVVKTTGIITTITVGAYPADGIGLLTYKVSVPLQYRDNSFTLPVVREGKLEGMLMRYDSRSQTADLAPAPVISAFLARAAKEPYRSVAKAGITYSSTRDPQLRRYLGLNGQKGGVYLSMISRGSAAEKSGLMKGDVLLAANGHAIDADGNYEHPSYGRIPFSNIFTTESMPGERVALKIFRGGKNIDLPMELLPRDPKAVISESYLIGKAPRYYMLGGLVFQELSRSYLREWGGNWRSDAPSRLVYLDEYQEELPADRGKIVFLSSVLPSDLTVGYEDLDNLVATKVNGREIKCLEDFAEALKSPIDGVHRIEFDSDPRVIFLDATKVDETAKRILHDYNIPAISNL